MTLFRKLYDRTVQWSQRPSAQYYLIALSFAEAFFFPIPPDVLLAPMTLARPKNGWRYAAIATLASTVGGLLGYVLGFFMLHLLMPYIAYWGYVTHYAQALTWFQHWGILALVIAGFTPIPYKLFTIAAGALGMTLPAFIIASLIGRGGRFFLGVIAIRSLGPKFEAFILPYLDVVGWWTLAVLLLIIWVY